VTETLILATAADAPPQNSKHNPLFQINVLMSALPHAIAAGVIDAMPKKPIPCFARNAIMVLGAAELQS
jgi:hypothetical protein